MEIAAPPALNDVETRRAEPLLASQLVSDAVLGALVNRLCSDDPRERRDRSRLLCTGVKSLDDALDGGLEDGTVVGIHHEVGAGGSEVSLAVFCLESLGGYPWARSVDV